jgi:hypothetical protein
MISNRSSEHEERSNSLKNDKNSFTNSLFSDTKSCKLNNEFPLKDEENKSVNSSYKKGEQLDTEKTKFKYCFYLLINDIRYKRCMLDQENQTLLNQKYNEKYEEDICLLGEHNDKIINLKSILHTNIDNKSITIDFKNNLM